MSRGRVVRLTGYEPFSDWALSSSLDRAGDTLRDLLDRWCRRVLLPVRVARPLDPLPFLLTLAMNSIVAMTRVVSLTAY